MGSDYFQFLDSTLSYIFVIECFAISLSVKSYLISCGDGRPVYVPI